MTSDQMKKEYSDNEKEEENKKSVVVVVDSSMTQTIDTHIITHKTTTRPTRVITWIITNNGDDDIRRVVCEMKVSVGEKIKIMICVNVNRRRRRR